MISGILDLLNLCVSFLRNDFTTNLVIDAFSIRTVIVFRHSLYQEKSVCRDSAWKSNRRGYHTVSDLQLHKFGVAGDKNAFVYLVKYGSKRYKSQDFHKRFVYLSWEE